MSLQTVQHASYRPVANCSRSSFLQVTKLESGIADFYDGAAGSDLATDLRSIGNKYDKLVLRMFNERSNLRGDVVLLKKDAQLLRNEMKCLIAKHDRTTAFKKGFSAETHEEERLLKAELVIKEMGQLEVALTDLMSKYYYLLQQTKTLKEINSLWHIKSVLKSDFLQMNFKKMKPNGKIGTLSMKNSIVKKDPRQIREESAKLNEKVRWLTTLGNEFRKEFEELRSAKMALWKGRSCLENEYCKISNIELIQDGIPRALNVNSIAIDIRNAELRIIDSLNERTEALDKLTDEFKELMTKAGFGGSNNVVLNQKDVSGIENAKPKLSLTQMPEGCCADRESIESSGKENACDPNEDSENEPEEIQVRYIRKDAIEDIDFRCLQPELKLQSPREAHEASVVEYRRNLYSTKQGEMSVRGGDTDRISIESRDNRAVGNKDLEAQQLSFKEEFVEPRDNNAHTVIAWLHPNKDTLAANDSEETLTGDIESNGEDEEDEEVRLCELIEKQFDDVEDDRRKHKRQKRKIGPFIERLGSRRESGKTVDRKSVDRFTKELTSLLSIASKSCNPGEDETISSSSCDATDCENRYERFHAAKNFFEFEPVKKNRQVKMHTERKYSVEESSEKDESISRQQNERGLDNIPSDLNIDHEEIQDEEKADGDAYKNQNCARGLSTESMQKLMTHENRPVFYDPFGTWKASGNNDKRIQRSRSSLSGSNTLDRNKKSKVDSTVSQGNEREAENPGATTQYALKTLPRGFKSQRIAEKDVNPLKVTGNVTPRRSSGDSGSRSCNTLPRKLKIRSSDSKETNPDSSVHCVNPNASCSTRKTGLTPRESNNNNNINNNNNNNKGLSKIKPITRSNSQLTSKEPSAADKSMSNNRDSFSRSGSRTPRTSSRTGSFRREANAQNIDASFRRPVSRCSMYRPESQCDNTRPKSRSGSSRQSSLSIYGTLPRTRKSITGQKEVNISENETNSLTPIGQKSGKSRIDGLDKRNTISVVGNESQGSSETLTLSNTSCETISSAMVDCQSERSRIDVNIKQSEMQSSIDDNQNTEENLFPHDTEASTSKHKKVRGIKANWSKNRPSAEEQHQKDPKHREERKAKKTVPEKAANFMQNALKRISSDSKTNVKSNTKNNYHSESLVKRRSQNVESRNEHRKSFIPVPTLS